MQSFTNSTRWWIIIDDEENDDNSRLGWYEIKNENDNQWSMTSWNIRHGCDNKNNSIIVDMVDDNDENLLKKLMATVWGLMTMRINDEEIDDKRMITVEMIDDNENGND